MITLKFEDARLKGLCNLWNAIPHDPSTFKNIHLLTGVKLDKISVHIM